MKEEHIKKIFEWAGEEYYHCPSYDGEKCRNINKGFCITKCISDLTEGILFKALCHVNRVHMEKGFLIIFAEDIEVRKINHSNGQVTGSEYFYFEDYTNEAEALKHALIYIINNLAEKE